MYANDNRRFMAAIQSRPDDDTPRLIYADWLEEQGDVRAELIRLQCRLERLPDDDPSRESHEIIEKKLVDVCSRSWREHSGIANVDYVHFKRGFVDTLHLRAEHLAENTEAIFKAAPLLRGVVLTEAEEKLREIVGRPQMQNLASLGLTGRLHSSDVYAISRSLSMATLTQLSFFNCELGQSSMRELGRSTVFQTLRDLRIGLDDRVRDDGVAEIAGCRAFPQLRVLKLIGCRIRSAGVRYIANAPRLTRLKTLNLAGNEIDDEGVSSLVLNSSASRFREISLMNNQIGDAGAQIIAQTPHLEDINQIDLRDNIIGSAAGEKLQQRFGDRVLLGGA